MKHERQFFNETRKTLFHQTKPFFEIIKWFAIASATGVISGFSTYLFLKALELTLNFTHSSFKNYFLLLPFAMALSSIILKHIVKTDKGYGTDELIEAIHTKSGKINLVSVPTRAVATLLTLSTGGSAGKWGPAVKVGVGSVLLMSKILKFKDEDVKKIAICGISGGFSAVFGTPIAGAIFGVEVLYVGNIMYDILFPSFVSGIVSYQVASHLGVNYITFPVISGVQHAELMLIEVVIGGIFFGLVAIMMVKTLKWGKILADSIHIWKPIKGIIGGVVIVILAYITNPKFLGLGVQVINDSLTGKEVEWYAFIMKIILTSITLNFGGSGGVATPMFFIGATSGVAFAKLMGLDPATFAAIGMVSVLAGAANTPISASIMAVEMFGIGIAPFAAISCIVSFLTTGYRGVFPTQVIVANKMLSSKREEKK